MVDKKYVVTVTTKSGEVSIGTDDVKGVLSQLGHGGANVSPTDASDGWSEVEAVSNHVRVVEEKLMQLRTRIVEVEKKMNEIVEVLNEAPAQPQPVQSPVIPQRPQSPASTAFMDITPDRMTQDIWGKFTQEQKEQYAAKYMQKK